MTDTETFSDFDDDTETGLADEYMAESKEARAKGDHELADELYTKANKLHAAQSGLSPDGTSLGDTDTESVTEGDTAATDSPGLPAPPDGEWSFARPEVVDYQFSMMEADFGELATDLRSDWGADAGRNLEFALAASLEFEAHYPELVATVTGRGAGADPLIVELLAVLGRQWAERPGDPSTVRLFPNRDGHGQEGNMSEINKDDFD